MFDLKRTLDLIKGMIVEPQPTWEAYYPESFDWQKTLGLLTIPLIVGTAILVWILSHLFGSFYLLGGGFGLGFMVMMIVYWAIDFGLFVVIISYLARFFKGEGDLARGVAAMSLATVPGWLGAVLSTVPWIGLLIVLAGLIWALVLVYRIVPLYLKVPDTSRVGHFIATIVAMIVVGVLLSLILGPGMVGRMPMEMEAPGPTSSSVAPFGQQADLIAAAESDRYDPPADGKLTDAQLVAYVDALRKTAELRGTYGEDMDRLAQSVEARQGEDPTFKDLGAAFSGFMKLGGMAMAEMEVVKTGGGNWAEHNWIKEQLRAAKIHKNSNEAIAHNWALYQKYQSDLQEWETTP